MMHHRPLIRGSALGLLLVAGTLATALAANANPKESAVATLGPNVTIFDPGMPVAEIQTALDSAYSQQVDNEMGTQRYAFLFKPGTYGSASQPLQIKVGYYTEIAGLGASPTDVVINGKVEVYNRCLEDGGTSNCLALVNFWRTLSNLSISVNGAGQDGCQASADFWAVSQAVSMRRVDITGANLSLMDYCSAGPQYASGGFIADSRLPYVISGSQQQWLTRNSEVAGWSNAVWNQVFSGVIGAPDDAGYPNPQYTTLDTTPISREKPYLFVDNGELAVRVPSAVTESRGVSWADGLTPGRTVPLSEFFVATPASGVESINNALSRGENLLLTPGVYAIDKTIKVKRADTVVLGLGQATLTAVDGAVPLEIEDVSGVMVAGITIDAGEQLSPVLLQVGKAAGNNHENDPTNPTTLSDVFFRVGGPHVGQTEVALRIDSDDVIIDHTWVWRGDHGVEGLTDTQRWNTNTGLYGVIVNGDNVTATGLFVEHFQRHNVVWNGEHGTTIFFQNELAYDPPTQAEWMNGDVEGWAAYKVGDAVGSHELYGAGVYCYNRNNPDIHTENGYEVPEVPGVRLHHIMTINLSGPGSIDHVVNGFGDAADAARGTNGVYVVEYPVQ